MDDHLIAAIECSTRAALARQGQLRGLTDEWVARTVVRQYFQTLPPISSRRHLVDVGAAAGGIAEVFLSDGWSADLCEPDPAWQPAMRRLVLAHAGRCRVHEVAVCDRDAAQISFAQNSTPGLSGLSISPFGSHVRSIAVRAVRLNTLLESLSTQRVDFLKVDTEGTDFDVLKAYDFERLPPALIFLEYSYYFPLQTPAVVRAGLDFLKARGYQSLIFEYDDDGNFKRGSWQHRLVAIHANPATLPRRPNSFGNVLFFRDADEHLPRMMLATIAALS